MTQAKEEVGGKKLDRIIDGLLIAVAMVISFYIALQIVTGYILIFKHIRIVTV